jgi:iron complex outermembrane receptor protein
VVDDQITGNLYLDYRFTKGSLDGTSVRVGVRNLTDEKPPLSSDGYLGTLYTPVSRYWYANIRHKF